MVTLATDEKKSVVMAYTPSMLLRGEVVNKESVRTSIWLRTDSAPEYMRFVNTQVLNFMGGQIRPVSYEELYFPVSQCFITGVRISVNPVMTNDSFLYYTQLHNITC